MGRDPAVPSLLGRYVYGDFCTGEVRSLKNLWTAGNYDDRDAGVSVPFFGLNSFGEDGCGHMYVAHFGGQVWRIDDETFVPCSSTTPPPEDPADPGPATGGEQPPGQQQPADPPPGPPAGPAPDATAPKLKLTSARLQRVLRKRRVVLAARCDESCAFTATARLTTGPRPVGVHLAPTTRSAAAGKRVRFSVRLKRSALGLLRRQIRRNGRATLRVQVKARDASGNGASATRRVTAVR
jgi:hypothetical protein